MEQISPKRLSVLSNAPEPNFSLSEILETPQVANQNDLRESDSQVDLEESKTDQEEFPELERIAQEDFRTNQLIQELNEEQRQLIEEVAANDGVEPEEQYQENRHEFDKEMIEFNEKFEQQIEKHITSNAYIDRKIVGSVIGLGLFGGIGFLVFNGTFFFGVGGSALGVVLGGIIGSRIRKKLNLNKLSIDKLVCFKVTHIIGWTKKNQSKIDQLWFAILIEKIIMDTKILLEHSNKKHVQQTLSFVRKFLTSKGCLKMLEPHIPTIEEFCKQEDMDKKKTIYKTFNFYVPFVQLINLSKNKKKYRSISILKKIKILIFSKDLVQNIQLFAQDPDGDSVVHLPEEDEFIDIIKMAVNERLYDPYAILEKRVMQCICLEKQIFSEQLNNSKTTPFRDDISDNNINKRQLLFSSESVPMEINIFKRAPFMTMTPAQQDLNKEESPLKKLPFVRGDSAAQMESESFLGSQSYRSKISKQESERQNSKYALDPSDIIIEKKDPIKECKDPDFIELLKIATEDVALWDKVSQSDNITIYKKMKDDSPVVLLKAYCLIEGYTPDLICEVMSNQTLRSQWDKVLSNFQIIEELEEGQAVLYFIIKTPIGISNRDFLQLRKTRKDFPKEGMTSIHYISTTHSKCPEKPKMVRGNTVIGGYILEEETNAQGIPCTRMIIISQNDIKGILPKAIVNMAAGKAPRQWVLNLIKGCDDYVKTLKQ